MSFTRRKFLKCCGGGMSAMTMLTALRYAVWRALAQDWRRRRWSAFSRGRQ